MSFVKEILTPIIIFSFFIGLACWILFLVWYFTKGFLKSIKKKVEKNKPIKYDEATVNWCMRAVKVGWDVEKVMAVLLNKGKPMDEIIRTATIFKEVKLKISKNGK